RVHGRRAVACAGRLARNGARRPGRLLYALPAGSLRVWVDAGRGQLRSLANAPPRSPPVAGAAWPVAAGVVLRAWPVLHAAAELQAAGKLPAGAPGGFVGQFRDARAVVT